MRPLLSLVALGLLLGPMLGLIVGFAIGGEDRLGWLAVLAVIVTLIGLAARIIWRAEQRTAAARRP